jgi:hypothetical protein
MRLDEQARIEYMLNSSSSTLYGGLSIEATFDPCLILLNYTFNVVYARKKLLYSTSNDIDTFCRSTSIYSIGRKMFYVCNSVCCIYLFLRNCKPDSANWEILNINTRKHMWYAKVFRDSNRKGNISKS